MLDRIEKTLKFLTNFKKAGCSPAAKNTCMSQPRGLFNLCVLSISTQDFTSRCDISSIPTLIMPLHLDHVIILVPYAWLSSPPNWIKKNFTITPGGRHADNKTENFLIVFRDGFYIEFIAFINDLPSNREGHWWGKKNFGIVDFALTSVVEAAGMLYAKLGERLGRVEVVDGEERVGYQRPVHGGRVRPDGQKVEWDVTFPVVDKGYQRGELPFFCQDRTSRDLRVPVPAASSTHPCGAYGVEEFYVYVSEERANTLAKVYEAVLDVENSVREDDPNFVGTFELKRLFDVPCAEGEGPVVVVGVPFEEEQSEKMEQNGGILLANLTLGGGEGRVLRRIDIGDESVGGIVAPAN